MNQMFQIIQDEENKRTNLHKQLREFLQCYEEQAKVFSILLKQVSREMISTGAQKDGTGIQSFTISSDDEERPGEQMTKSAKRKIC